MSKIFTSCSSDSGISTSEDYDQPNIDSPGSSSNFVAVPFRNFDDDHMVNNFSVARIESWNSCRNENSVGVTTSTNNNVRELAIMFDALAKEAGQSLYPESSTIFAGRSGEKENKLTQFDESKFKCSDEICKNPAEARSEPLPVQHCPVYFDSDDENEISEPIDADNELVQSIQSVKNIILEIIVSEENYVKTLESGMKNYVSALDCPDLPIKLREQKLSIFSNIYRIYDLHANLFCPALQSSVADIMKISEIFTNYIKNGYFYCYIVFMQNRETTLKLCDENTLFFQGLERIANDKLGVYNFLIQPIQRLPKYKLLLAELGKELSRNADSFNIKPMIDAVRNAETHVERFLNTINESLTVNEIVQEKHEIDLGHQGQFRKMNVFKMYDHSRNRSYQGRLFLFEKCLIYTETKNSRSQYRGHYKIKEFGVYGSNANQKFCLFAKKVGRQQVDFDGTVNWNELLHKMLMEDAIEVIHRKSNLRFEDQDKNSDTSFQGNFYEVANSMWYA